MTFSRDDADQDLIALLGDYLDRGETPPEQLLAAAPENRIAFDAQIGRASCRERVF